MSLDGLADFRGVFLRKTDSKSRVAFPSEFRKAFERRVDNQLIMSYTKSLLSSEESISPQLFGLGLDRLRKMNSHILAVYLEDEVEQTYIISTELEPQSNLPDSIMPFDSVELKSTGRFLSPYSSYDSIKFTGHGNFVRMQHYEQ